MITLIVALVSLAVGAAVGYKEGHIVATKAAAEALKLKEAASAVKKAL